MGNTKMQNIISFCTGYGGIELGIKRTGFPVRTVAYVEIEAFAVANLVAKIEKGKMDAAPIWTDLKTFDGRPFRNKVHGIIGGYPCQPFSVAGKQQGDKDPRHLWPFIRDHVATIRPSWVFFENVAGHLRLGFDRVVRDLDEMGYDIQAGLFTAAEVGAPHKRERLFILAYRECVRSDTGTERTGRQAGANADWGGKGAKLANSESSDGRLLVPERRQNETVSESARTGKGKKLANTKDTERGRLSEKYTGRRTLEAGGSGRGELAVADSGRSSKDRQQCELRTNSTGESPCNTGNREAYQERQGRWPARPGQPQYEWEEPRTVKPGMGRTVDGFASRVDELRLLGNGVVPQTAELAFRTLWNKTSQSISNKKRS